MILDLEQDELSGEIAISKDHKENLFLRSLQVSLRLMGVMKHKM